MKVAFVGKGGSGKTTITSLLTLYLASQQMPIIAIDADINQHLSRALGIPEELVKTIPPMGIQINRIKEYLKGNNKRINDQFPMIKTTPPGFGSRLLRFEESNPIFDYFSIEHKGITFLAVGPFSESDLGVKCYHSKTGAVELILNHFIDSEQEYIITDMTAGADSFASGLFTRFDVTFVVVEPTLQSLDVYKQYREYSDQYNVTVKVIANKIEDVSDMDFLLEHVDSSDIVAQCMRMPFIKKFERGTPPTISLLDNTCIHELQKIQSCIDNQHKDWNTYYNQAVEFHLKNAQSWANESLQSDLENQIDPNFSLKELL